MYRRSKYNKFTRQISGRRVKLPGNDITINTENLLQNPHNDRPIRLGMDEIKNLIPPFNPSSPTGLTSKQWIDAIENIRMIYNWDDRLTLLYATVRLEERAKKWFNANLCKWQAFKEKLVIAFPYSVDKRKIYDQLISRHKEDTESIENFSFVVEQMAKACDFDMETTINYIISGLRDGGIRTHLIACNCQTISELLLRYKSYISVQNQIDLRNRLDHSKNLDEPSTSSDRKKVCFKCNEPGHVKKECKLYIEWKRKIEEKSGENPPKKVYLEKITNNYSDLVKTIKVDGIYLSAFVHLGSDCTTLQLSEFEKHDWKMEKYDLKLRGFGQGSATAIGKITKNVGAGEVEMLTDILIVKDELQEFPMVLGRNFLDKPQVCVIKKFGSLEIKFVDDKATKGTEITELKSEICDDIEDKQMLELLEFIERDYL